MEAMEGGGVTYDVIPIDLSKDLRLVAKETIIRIKYHINREPGLFWEGDDKVQFI